MKRNTLISYSIIVAVYLLAVLSGKITLDYLEYENAYIEMLLADIVATVVVFFFSYLFKNSSVYDPYWSIIPIPIVIYWIAENPGGSLTRQMLVLGIMLVWSIRLTINWMKSWPNLVHEDWRYKKLSEETGKLYWLVSLAGIHLFPTILVFMGLIPVLPAVSTSASISIFDKLGTLVALAAIGIEYISDEQLRNFKKSHPEKSANMETGLWSISRHPNYLGEILFWLGLYIISLSAGVVEYWWTGIGFLSMILLFNFISIPMMEKRLVKSKDAYKTYQQKVPPLLPRHLKNYEKPELK